LVLDLIFNDPFSDRQRFVVSKTSYYWLNKSINLMQQHIEYGTTFDAAMIAEITEVERNLKVLKSNVAKNGIEKTFFYRAEALLNFIRICCTFFGKYNRKKIYHLSKFLFYQLENPLEKFHRRLHALFNVCASCWLHMFDIMLPKSIVRVEKSFLLDDDDGDFVNDSALKHFLKDDQKKIKSKFLQKILQSFLFINRCE
jgi:hypothetical protein